LLLSSASAPQFDPGPGCLWAPGSVRRFSVLSCTAKQTDRGGGWGWMGLGWCRHGGGQRWCGQGGLEVEAIHTRKYLVLPEILLFPHSLSLFPDCHLGLAWKHLTLASVPWIPWILSHVPTGTWLPCATLTLAPCSFRSSRAYSDWIVPIAAHTPHTHSSNAATEDMPPRHPSHSSRDVVAFSLLPSRGETKDTYGLMVSSQFHSHRTHSNPPRPSSLRGW